MKTYCDLHTHSVFSDGTDTPEQLIELAAQAGLSAVALCDHNTVAGLPDFLKAAQGTTVEAVPGVEISTDFADKELLDFASAAAACSLFAVNSTDGMKSKSEILKLLENCERLSL